MLERIKLAAVKLAGRVVPRDAGDGVVHGGSLRCTKIKNVLC